MKRFALVTLCLMSVNTFATQEDWINISCSLSAARFTDKTFIQPLDMATRINFVRKNGVVKMTIKGAEGDIRVERNLQQLPSHSGKHFFANENFSVEVGPTIGSVKTEVTVYKNGRSLKRVAQLTCSSL